MNEMSKFGSSSVRAIDELILQVCASTSSPPKPAYKFKLTRKPKPDLNRIHRRHSPINS